jgi:hypothetical protein
MKNLKTILNKKPHSSCLQIGAENFWIYIRVMFLIDSSDTRFNTNKLKTLKKYTESIKDIYEKS